MDRNEIAKALAVAIKRARGYADFFDWPDKSVKEWGVVQSFVDELHRDHGPMIAEGKQHPGVPNHAPDFQLTTVDGKVWGVEITELVSRVAIHETKRGNAVFAEWPDDELVSAFRDLVARKDRPENVKGGPYDRYVLLVHVDEAMLPASRLQRRWGSSILRRG